MKSSRERWILSLLTLFAMLWNSSAGVYAFGMEQMEYESLAEAPPNEEEIDALLDACLTDVIELNDEIDRLEKDFGITLDVKPADLIATGITPSEAQIEEARAFLNDYIRDYGAEETEMTPSQYADAANSEQSAKAKALMYAFRKARESVAKDPSLNIEDEARYMFLSHFVDRNDYYWRNGDINHLLDGSVMSGVDGYLAEYLTETDRRVYTTYMNITDGTEVIGSFAKTAFELYKPNNWGLIASTRENLSKIREYLTESKHAFRRIRAAMHATLIGASAGDSIQEIRNVVSTFRARWEEHPTESLNEMYNYYMSDDRFLAQYETLDRMFIAQTAFVLLLSGILAGPGVVGAVALASGGALASNFLSLGFQFTVDVYGNFFRRTAWIVMRYGFSGRYAERVALYYGW